MRAPLLVLSATVLLGCTGGPATPAATRPGDGLSSELPLLPYFRDLRVVQVGLGADTLRLLLDTGGGATLITPTVATRQGCHVHGADIGHRMSGEEVVFQRCDSLRITLGNRSLRFAPVGVFDVNALLPPELPRLDGVLALDAFRGHVVTLDWPGGHVVIRDGPAADSAAAGSGIPFRPATGESGRFFSALARVEGSREPLWFLLDTGNLRGTLVSTRILKDSLLPLADAAHAGLRISGGTWLTGFTAAELILDGALGTDYLGRGPVTLDLRRFAP